jgi:hypothetical protein
LTASSVQYGAVMKRRSDWKPERGLAAAAGLLVWLAGLYVLPVLHNIDHRPDHTHGGHRHSHSHAHPHDSAPSEEHDHDAPDADHGEGSILHFAAAVIDAQPVVLPELVGSVLPANLEPARSVAWPVLLAFLARGPPLP